MKHGVSIEGFSGSLDRLADEIGNLRYDATAAFLTALANKLREDAAADRDRGRPRLAEALSDGSDGVAAAATAVGRAWTIAAPYMSE